MRINIRMMGILYGILLMALIGRMLLESIRFLGNRSSKDDKGSGGIIAFLVVSGLVLLILGWIGHFIGGLIKAAVCRQREYLADASAVQFTRNPNGIGGALKRIGALLQHGRIEHRNAAMASHMFFAQAVSEGISQLLATHPPLIKRILAIDPGGTVRSMMWTQWQVQQARQVSGLLRPGRVLLESRYCGRTIRSHAF